ncbi:MAG: transposase [Muribaculaceae bacterium]|nr:transposase [Muribaculaceae bacterium]
MDNSNERRKQWIASHPELVVKPSMKRRKIGHDYNGVAIYMVTLCIEGRRPVLGTLNGPDDRHALPWVCASEVGRAVKRAWQEIPQYHPQVRLLGFQLMPDHVHGIIYVKEPMPQHLGRLIQGFKKGCRDALKQMGVDGVALWEEGYNDRILKGQGQLKRWMNYLMDNPRRLWIRRNHADLFHQQNNVVIGSSPVTIMGNRFLLDFPDKVAVKCSRRLTSQEIDDECKRYLSLASHGAVLVSPCISTGEKEVMGCAFEAGYPIILLLENGFSPYQKPSGRQFDACSEGRLLLVAPWPHHDDYRKITREQCNTLNSLAQSICRNDWQVVK